MRTEEDKIFQTPVIVKLGGKNHEIPPLVIKESREWRKKIVTLMVSIKEYASVKSDDPGAFESALNNLFVTTPDAAADLFFSYAKTLNRKEIEDIATDAEIAQALQEIMAIAFPLLKSLAGMTRQLL